MESECLRFDSSWDSEFFFVPIACDKTKKTSFSIGTLNSKISFPVFLCEFKCNLHKQLMFFSNHSWELKG